MMEEMSQEQKDRLFERLIVGASDILCEEFGLPRKSFAEILEMISRGKDAGENDTVD